MGMFFLSVILAASLLVLLARDNYSSTKFINKMAQLILPEIVQRPQLRHQCAEKGKIIIKKIFLSFNSNFFLICALCKHLNPDA